MDLTLPPQSSEAAKKDRPLDYRGGWVTVSELNQCWRENQHPLLWLFSLVSLDLGSHHSCLGVVVCLFLTGFKRFALSFLSLFPTCGQECPIAPYVALREGTMIELHKTWVSALTPVCLLWNTDNHGSAACESGTWWVCGKALCELESAL